MSFLNELLASLVGTAAAVLVYSWLVKRHLRKIEREWDRELQQRRPAHNPFSKKSAGMNELKIVLYKQTEKGNLLIAQRTVNQSSDDQEALDQFLAAVDEVVNLFEEGRVK